MKGRVLIIAGSDSGGGAGIQADIKTVTALGGFAMTAITALTAQNTQGVFGIHEVPIAFIADQMRLVIRDIGADCVKIGMLHRPDVIEVVADTLEAEAPDVPVVVDPVMVAKGGASLLERQAVATLKRRIVPRARVLTPNLPEAAALVGFPVTGKDDAERAARSLAAMGPRAVLMKGGHMTGPILTDMLFEDDRLLASFDQERLDTPHTHGNRLYHRVGGGDRHRPRSAPARCRGPRLGLCAGSDPDRARIRAWTWTAEPRPHGSILRRIIGRTGEIADFPPGCRQWPEAPFPAFRGGGRRPGTLEPHGANGPGWPRRFRRR